MAARTLRSRARATAPSEDATSGAPAHSSAEPEAAPPPKRRRAAAKEPKKPRATAVKNTRKQGRLSVLPTLPLDLIYLIFEHLGPADIINLTRVNKSFRGILLARQSCFLWKNVLERCEDYPDELPNNPFPCPEDVFLPYWVTLVHGGPKCDTCGARANKVLWRVRRRLCKGCQKTLLVSHGDACMMLPLALRVSAFNFNQFLPNEFLNNHFMYLREDVRAFAGELAKIPIPVPDVLKASEDRTPWQEAVRALVDARQKECEARTEHAQECELHESYKKAFRTSDLGQIKRQRFEDVRDRLLAEGFELQDAESQDIQEHKEVYQAKPLTDRVWTRIAPIMREACKEVRDNRLEDERLQRLAFREEVFRMSYEDGLLPSTQPSTLSFMPTLMAVRKIPRVERFLAEDVDWQNREESPAELVRVVEGMADYIRAWATRRQASLRALLPAGLPRAAFSRAEAAAFWPPCAAPPRDGFPPLDLFAEIADLDLAALAFACTSPSCAAAPPPRRVFFGVDLLAHQCCYQRDMADCEVRAEFDRAAHEAVLRVLELLELDAARTRPVDLDTADRIFVLKGEESRPGSRSLMTWRQAVEAWVATPPPTADCLELASPLEETYVHLMSEASSAGRIHKVEHEFAWGCTRCSALVEHSVMFVALPLVTVRTHIAEAHDVAYKDAREGRDYFHFRRTQRHSRHVYAAADGVDLEARVEVLRESQRAQPDRPQGIEQDLLTMSLMAMLMNS